MKGVLLLTIVSLKLCEKWKVIRFKKNPNPWCKLIILLCWYCFVVMRTLFYPQELLLECSLSYLVWRFVSWIKHYKLCSACTIQYSFIESCGKIHLLPSRKKEWKHNEIHPSKWLLHKMKWKCSLLFIVSELYTTVFIYFLYAKEMSQMNQFESR